MILTYFERKVNLLGVIHSSIHRAETVLWVVFAKKNERSESFVPEFVVTVTGFCQKKWLLHYGINTILGSPELSRQVCLAEGMHLGGSSPLSILPLGGCEAFWTTEFYHYDPYMGETVYTVGFS